MPRRVEVTGGPGFPDYMFGRRSIQQYDFAKRHGHKMLEKGAKRNGVALLKDARKKGLTTEPPKTGR
jgi:hypothetical protein